MDNREMFEALGIKPEVYDYCEVSLNGLKDRFKEIDEIAEYNQLKVVKAMQDANVSEAHLIGTSGY
jgi:cystathionine beta-lyase family protein involved in aluminum resistance